MYITIFIGKSRVDIHQIIEKTFNKDGAKKTSSNMYGYIALSIARSESDRVLPFTPTNTMEKSVAPLTKNSPYKKCMIEVE